MSAATFLYRRRVAFGDCDSARIYFAPRAVDYAVEAVEAWHEAVLGISWVDLSHRHRLEAGLVRVGCQYLRPVMADQVVQVKVYVVALDRGTITFAAVGSDESGEDCFRATCVTRFLRRHVTPVPIPALYRQKIEAWLAQNAAEPAPPEGVIRIRRGAVDSDPAVPPPGSTMLTGIEPFTSTRRVVYGDCTISGTVYPPRIVNYAVEAVGEWYRETLGISWQQQCIAQRGAPFLEIRCEPLSRMVPGDAVTMAVMVSRLGNSSIDYTVTGYRAGRVPCFEVRMSACYITEAAVGSYQAIPFPDAMRDRILAYQAACGACHTTLSSNNTGGELQ